jgi:CysZ protein
MGVLEAGRGFRLAFRGVAFLGQHRALWRWALLPAAVNVVVFAAAFVLFFYVYDDLYTMVTGFFSFPPPEAWYAWLWVAPLRVLAWSIGFLMLVAFVVSMYFAFLILGTIIATPFLAVLAQRVEEIVTGHIAQERTTFLGAVHAFGTSLADEIRRLVFFLGVQLILFLLSFIPLLSPLTVTAATLFTMLFLPLEYAGFAMDQRHLRFPQRRALIWQHRWTMLGFGAAAFLTLLIPLLNFVCLPALVVGGTLLILHIEAIPASSS